MALKTREGCGCFRGLCRSSAGKFRENSGKIAGKFFPNREMLQILGFRAPGKENLPETLGPHCRDLAPTLCAGCFLKSTVPAFSSFSDNNVALKTSLCFLVLWLSGHQALSAILSVSRTKSGGLRHFQANQALSGIFRGMSLHDLP